MCDSDEYELACPACDERLTVNESMRAALLENGCVVCGSDLTAEAFACP